MTNSIALTALLVSTLVLSCDTNNLTEERVRYLRYVGDIVENPKLDNSEFKICHNEDEVLQYYNVGRGPVYVGEKSDVIELFESRYEPVRGEEQDGMLRIRFIVNCSGQAGRFRVMQADPNYKKFEFNRRVVSQLTEITESIGEWEILYYEGTAVDYYYYIIFKIVDGRILEIMP